MTRWLRTRMRSLFRRRGVEHELDREIQFHLDMLAEQHVRAGMSPDAARCAALRSFGGVDRVKEDVRDTWLSRLFETLAQDVRYGARNLRRNPALPCDAGWTSSTGAAASETSYASRVSTTALKERIP